MSENNTVQENSEKLCLAFQHFRNKHKGVWTWENISRILKESGKEFDFGMSATNVMGIFGVGGKRSPLIRNSHISKKFYTAQKTILQEINKFINPIISFENDEPQFSGNDFIYLERDGTKIEFSVEKDVFLVYYWRHGAKIGNGILTLFKSDQHASFQVIYSHQENNLLLAGNYTVAKGVITVNLYDKKDKKNNPYSQIVFSHSAATWKDCYYGTFSSAHRGGNMFPVAGALLLFPKEKGELLNKHINVEAIACYFLNSKRIKVQSTGFDLTMSENGRIETDDTLIKPFFDIIIYQGIYQFFFVNPRLKTFETGLIKISDYASASILVDARRHTSPFTGIVRILPNKSLMISYDHMDELGDFRMKMILDISRYPPGNKMNILGLISGLEYQTKEPVISTIVVKLVTPKNERLEQHSAKIKILHLDKKEDFKTFEKLLTEQGLRDFFHGTNHPEMTSIGTIVKMKNEHHL